VRATEVNKDKAEALAIFATALMREILREDASPPPPVELMPGPDPSAESPRSEDEAPGTPMPLFDFDESNDVCEHNGIWIPRETCPEHGPGADVVPTIEELDDMESEDVSGPIQRARRIAENKAKQEGKQRLFPEDLPMRGMGPPPGDDE
jgi:hypothetical protein